jgi:hypothetical protein
MFVIVVIVEILSDDKFILKSRTKYRIDSWESHFKITVNRWHEIVNFRNNFELN